MTDIIIHRGFFLSSLLALAACAGPGMNEVGLGDLVKVRYGIDDKRNARGTSYTSQFDGVLSSTLTLDYGGFTPAEEAEAQKALSEKPDNEGIKWRNKQLGEVRFIPTYTSNAYGRTCRGYYLEFLKDYSSGGRGWSKNHNTACLDPQKDRWVPQRIGNVPIQSVQ